MNAEIGRSLLASAGDLDLRIDSEVRKRYSRDASALQIEPTAVAVARSYDDVDMCLSLAREHNVGLTARAGGSSVAGQCLGEGLVLDVSELDTFAVEGDLVRCGPGVGLDSLNRVLARKGRTIGPNVTSSKWARVGGLISTNACGSRSLRYGRFGDILEEATVQLASGERLRLARGDVPDRLAGPLRDLGAQLDRALVSWPIQHRTYGGYRLDQFARSQDVLSLVPGSEGTLCILLEAVLRTVAASGRSTTVVAEYDSAQTALEDAEACVEVGAVAVEFLDHNLAAALAAEGHIEHPADCSAALILEFLDRDDDALRTLHDQLGAATVRQADKQETRVLQSVRSGALELVEQSGKKAVAIFEDLAVPVERIAPFYRDLSTLLNEYGFEALIYGHAAAGCLHVRLLIDPDVPSLAERLRTSALAVADLICRHGGALTGEHGWGRTRSWLARDVLGSDLYEAFKTVKSTFDSSSLLNPGQITDAEEPFAHLKVG